MPDPARPQTIGEFLDDLRKTGRVPLGVVSFDPRNNELFLQACPDVSIWELQAVLAKFKMSFTVEK